MGTRRAVAPKISAEIKLFRDYGRRLIVRGYTNSTGPHDYIVDTASTRTAIFENLAAKIPFIKSGAPPVQIIGLSGVRPAQTYEIGDLAIADLQMRDLTAPILPDWPNKERTPQGILGLDFFQDTIAIFDNARRTLTITPSAMSEGDTVNNWAPAGLERTNFGLAERDLYVVEIEFLARKKVPFLLDTGSNITVCNYAAADYLEVLPREARRPPADIMDVHGDSADGFYLAPARFRIGGADLNYQAIAITGAPFFDNIGKADEPFGILGVNSLLPASFAIDFPRARLYLRTL